MTLNLDLLAANLILATSLVGAVWAFVWLDERMHRRRARKDAERSAKAEG